MIELPALIKILRPKQWTKNFMAFAPILFAGKIHELDLLVAVGETVIAFTCVSGSIYVLNDVLDREADRNHPTKKSRPIAAGKVSVPLAIGVGITSMIVGLAVGFFVRPAVDVVLLAYILLQFLYSFFLKRVPILDLFCIASGFVLRALAGGAAAHVPLSAWFLLCTSFGALLLALEKRRHEVLLLGADAVSHRKVLGAYPLDFVNRMEAVIVPSLVTFYGLYTFNSPYGQWMMLTIPFVLYGVLRYQNLSATGTSESSSTGAPEDVLLKDKPIQITIILWVLTSALIVYNILPNVVHSLIECVDGLKR